MPQDSTRQAQIHPRTRSTTKDCIGAIDGTHVKAKLRGGNNVPYRGRKSSTTQNVMCAVDFDLCFTYVYASWEGSAHDLQVFFECINGPKVHFPTPVRDYNYLVDSRYSCFKGFLPQHRNNIYHQEAFRTSGVKPRNAMELFNYRHSSLRSVVERTFGIWKARFNIFEDMPPYPIENQRLFVVAYCAVHNFIRKDEGQTDRLFKEALQQMYEQDWVDVSLRNNMPRTQYVKPGLRPDRTKASKEYMIAYRATVAEHMWSTVHGR